MPGWSIPGTKINYPVVRSDNTEYYLHHLFTGKESKLGCLFSLKSSDYQIPSRNIAIYGHHISHSDAMFSTLMDYNSDLSKPKKFSMTALSRQLPLRLMLWRMWLSTSSRW